MHEEDTGRAVANPRRTRLGSDWTSRSAGGAEHSQPTTAPGPDASAGKPSLG